MAPKLPEGVIAQFDAVITTKAVDRDGDVLLPEGATLDQNMALLWQHDTNVPIGKFVGTVDRDSDRIVGRFQLADLPLARDAKKLLEMGALKIVAWFQARGIRADQEFLWI